MIFLSFSVTVKVKSCFGVMLKKGNRLPVPPISPSLGELALARTSSVACAALGGGKGRGYRKVLYMVPAMVAVPTMAQLSCAIVSTAS